MIVADKSWVVVPTESEFGGIVSTRSILRKSLVGRAKASKHALFMNEYLAAQKLIGSTYLDDVNFICVLINEYHIKIGSYFGSHTFSIIFRPFSMRRGWIIMRNASERRESPFDS
jgi:hypothetical protein